MIEHCPASELEAGTVCIGEGARQGIGIRVDCHIPFARRVRLVHWLVAPYADTPSAGIVEDAGAMRLYRVIPAGSLKSLTATALQMALPASRLDRRNLHSADGKFLLGLRGWDIPHDRHMVLTATASWTADITGAALPERWNALSAVCTEHGISPLQDQERQLS